MALAQPRKIVGHDLEAAAMEHSVLAEFGELFLPLLSPSELASVASSCKTLYEVSKSITTRRTGDASRSLENIPIPFVNNADEQPYAFFIYTPLPVITSSESSFIDRRQYWGANAVDNTQQLSGGATKHLICEALEDCSGCSCDKCEEVSDGLRACPCLRLKSSEIMTECGPRCCCGLDCGNRLTQNGISVRLKVVKDRRKGWGLHADQLILQGQFVCEYAGELLTTKEARARQNIYDRFSTAQGGSALMVVREHLPSQKACIRINIDATRVGNIARFINHSCDGGNLVMKLVRTFGAVLPRICFFAMRDLHKNEELSFCYGISTQNPNRLQCFCNSLNCSGSLPSEET